MADLELLIIIINYKTKQMTIDCLKSTLPQLNEKHHIVIIDNLSNDGSAEAIEAWITQESHQDKISFIYSTYNSGFSGGNNLGIKQFKAKYYLLLNSDTLLREHALSTLLSSAEEQPEYGLFSPRLEWPDETPQISCFRFHRPLSEFISAAGTGIVTSLLTRWDIPLPLQSKAFSPEWTSFAAVLIRGKVFDEIGQLDEGYFLYYEDVDFCKMAANAGWRIWHEPNSRVVHLRGGSSPVKSDMKKKNRLPRFLYESRARYYAKHYKATGLLAANLCWLSGRLISLALEALGKKSSPVCEKQYIDIWANFSSPLKPFRSEE